MRYWTSDVHFGHPNIIKHANRPFIRHDKYINPDGTWKSEELKHLAGNIMNERLIALINSRVRDDDFVYHVGDFCCKGSERGESGDKTKAKEWLSRLNGHWTFFEGNHDGNNRLKNTIDMACVRICGKMAFVQHKPISLAAEVPDFCDYVICGHVHNSWQTKKIEGIWHVNVGVDANRYVPLSDNEVSVIYEKTARSCSD